VDVGRALAAAVCESKGSRDFAFEDDGRTLRVSSDAEWGVRAWRCPEAAMTVRIVLSKWCSVDGIWSPLFPNVTEIEVGNECQIAPRTFAGLTFSRVESNCQGQNATAAFGGRCLGFDETLWRVSFREGQSAGMVLSGRDRMTSRKSLVSSLQNVKNGDTSEIAMTLRSPVRDFDHSTFVLTCSVSVKERLRALGWKLLQCRIA
jgi:hypothetical protein